MPDGTILRRSLLGIAAIITLLTTQVAFAQASGPQTGIDGNSAAPTDLAIDRQLAQRFGGGNAQQYVAPVILPDVITETTPVDSPAAAGFDAAAAAKLEKEIEAALADAAAEKKAKKPVPAKRALNAAPSPWSTAVVVTGALALLALVSLVLTLAVRELRQDAKQRRRTYRRRIRRREPVSAAPASAG